MPTKKPAVKKTRRGRVDGASIVYQLEYVLCGKPRCNALHGPYWYAYWTHQRRTGKRYIGRKFKRLETIAKPVTPKPAAEIKRLLERARREALELERALRLELEREREG